MRKINEEYLGMMSGHIGALVLPPRLDMVCDEQLAKDFAAFLALIAAHAENELVIKDDKQTITLKIHCEVKPPGYALGCHIDTLTAVRTKAQDAGDVVQEGRLADALDEAYKMKNRAEARGKKELRLTCESSLKLSTLHAAGSSLLMPDRDDETKMQEVVQMELFAPRHDA